jgi:hypothetical protein
MQKITRWGIRSHLMDIFDDEHKHPFASYADCLGAAARFGCKQIMCETLTLDFDGEVKDVEVDVYPILPVQSDDAPVENDSSKIEHQKRTAQP